MRFAYLDGMRGIAALFVVARHWDELLGFDLHFGHLAVDLFFMLSGVVIAHAYDDKLRNGKIGAGGFMAIRFARLYPMYALATLLCIVSVLLPTWSGTLPGPHADEWLVSGILALLFVPFPVSGVGVLFPLNGSVWSLFFELVTNAGYAYGRRLLTDRFLAAAIAVTGLLMVAMAARTGTLDHGYGNSIAAFGAGAARATFGIAAGLLMYRRRAALAALARGVPAWGGVALVTAVMLLPTLPGWTGPMEVLSVFIVFPLAIVVASSGEPAPGWPMRTMIMLGTASYPIYLLHTPVLRLLKLAMGAGKAPLAGLAAMAGLVAVSLLIERHIDTPIRAWLRSRLLGRPAIAQA